MASKNYLLEVLLVQLVGLCWHVETFHLYLPSISPGYTITSPDYPLHPTQKTNMTWRLAGPSNKRLNIECSVSLLKRSGCSEGVLSIEGIREEPVNLCNEISSYRRQSRGNLIVLQFRTSRYGRGRFKCFVRVAQKHDSMLPAAYLLNAGNQTDKMSCECGKIKDKNKKRIVGGQETGANEYPFMAYLKLKKGNNSGLICGGSIITIKHILTAYDCVNNQNIQLVQVVVGGHNLSTGWGGLSYNLEMPDTLQAVELRVVQTERCIKSHKTMEIVAQTKSPICTFTDNKDICKGDSGGPLIYRDPEVNRWIQVGIISVGGGRKYGTPLPALHTRVLSYFDWIQRKIGPTNNYMSLRLLQSGLEIYPKMKGAPETCEKIEILQRI